MLPILTAAQMRQCDEYTVAQGTPAQTLMERAARAAIEVLRSEDVFNLSQRPRILLLCGSGNNGGDGFAMARFLWMDGHDVTVCYGGKWNERHYPSAEHMSTECARQYTLWQRCGGKTRDELPPLPSERCIVIDALVGIGLSRAPEGKLAAWIEAINQSNLPVLAMDIPSGVHADTGEVLGCAMRASVTATVAYPKLGLLLHPGTACVGKLRVCHIGITTEAIHHPQAWQTTPDDLAHLLSRPPYANKGTFGRVLVIGGALGMSGAVYFAAKAAYRAGCGLVEILSDEQNRIVLQTLLPEAVFTSIDISSPSNVVLDNAIKRADSIVLGCGLGRAPEANQLVGSVLRRAQKPLVLDADALYLLAASPALQSLLKAYAAPIAITPHLGEAARLMHQTVQEMTENLISCADALANNYETVCVLKDARTVVSDGDARYLQTAGNSGMATGGSGDCLAGLLGSLAAQHRPAALNDFTKLCALGVLIHAQAGDYAAAHVGEHAVMASDIADAIGMALHQAAIS